MAIVICCPCGNPIDFEHLELVVTLTCPQCKKEIDLEIENSPVDRRRAVLTVMEGPHWVGERFIIPVGVDLKIGQATGNWISLDDPAVAKVHCRLHLNTNGDLVLVDHQSQTGTWVGPNRVTQGRLAPKQSFRVGGFRLRLDYQSCDGSTIAAPTPSSVIDASGILPTMTAVRKKLSLIDEIVSNRFRVARWIMIVTTWLTAAYHGLALHQLDAFRWRWPASIAGALLLGSSLTIASRRVTLIHANFKYVPLVMLLGLAIADLSGSLPLPAICALGVAAAVSGLIVSTPSATLAVMSVICGFAAGLALLIGALLRLSGGA